MTAEQTMRPTEFDTDNTFYKILFPEDSGQPVTMGMEKRDAAVKALTIDAYGTLDQPKDMMEKLAAELVEFNQCLHAEGQRLEREIISLKASGKFKKENIDQLLLVNRDLSRIALVLMDACSIAICDGQRTGYRSYESLSSAFRRENLAVHAGKPNFSYIDDINRYTIELGECSKGIVKELGKLGVQHADLLDSANKTAPAARRSSARLRLRTPGA